MDFENGDNRFLSYVGEKKRVLKKFPKTKQKENIISEIELVKQIYTHVPIKLIKEKKWY